MRTWPLVLLSEASCASRSGESGDGRFQHDVLQRQVGDLLLVLVVRRRRFGLVFRRRFGFRRGFGFLLRGQAGGAGAVDQRDSEGQVVRVRLRAAVLRSGYARGAKREQRRADGLDAERHGDAAKGFDDFPGFEDGRVAVRHGGRRPAIRVFVRCSIARRGWRAFARHDDTTVAFARRNNITLAFARHHEGAHRRSPAPVIVIDIPQRHLREVDQERHPVQQRCRRVLVRLRTFIQRDHGDMRGQHAGQAVALQRHLALVRCRAQPGRGAGFDPLGHWQDDHTAIGFR